LFRAVAKSVVARSNSDEATPNWAEGDCFASLAMTVKKDCNSPAALLLLALKHAFHAV
jgi:hypothetical protein